MSGTGKATDFKFGRYIYRGHPNKRPLKFWRKGSVGVSRGCSKSLGTPIISGTVKATNFKFGRYIPRVHLNKKPIKSFEKRERGRIQGLPKILSTLLSQERVKLHTSNLAGTFIGSIRTKAH